MTDCFSKSQFTPCHCQVACSLGRIRGRVKSGAGQSLTGPWIWKRPSVWPSCTWQRKSELLQVMIGGEDRGTRSYEKKWHRRCIAQMPEREQFITQVGALFVKELFLDSQWHDLRPPLAALHQQCKKRIWGRCKTSLSYDIYKVMRDLPAELSVDISEDKLLQQFARLWSWLQSLEKEPYGHEFYEPKSFLVKAVNTTDNLPFRVSADKIDTSHWAYR